MALFVALDSGGTKTLCLVVDGEGRLVGSGSGGGANPNLVGEVTARESVRRAVEQAWARAIAQGRGHDGGPVWAALSGPSTAQAESILREVTGATTVQRISESEAAWAGVRPWIGREYDLPLDIVVTVDAGTGSTASGRNRAGDRVTVGGWGWLLGDEGGGFWVGLQGVRAAVYGEDGRGEPTQLAEAIRRTLGLSRLWELVPMVYGSAEGRQRIASLAPVVADVARAGDVVARGILGDAGRQLGTMVVAVVQRLHLEDEAFAVVMFGSVFKAGPALLGAFRSTVSEAAHRAVPVVARYESVVGTLVSAMACAGVDAAEVWPRLEADLAATPRVLVA